MQQSFIQSPDFRGSKEQELLTVLNNLERSYDPNSPTYKFGHIFYNVVDQPFDRPANFPPHLWAQSLLPDKTLMPVILNRAQIDERRGMQNDLAKKINESQGAIYKKCEALQAKREALRERLGVLCAKYRRIAGQYLMGDGNKAAQNISIEIIGREKLLVKHSRGEVAACLVKMRDRLLSLEKGVSEALSFYEKKYISDYQLNR